MNATTAQDKVSRLPVFEGLSDEIRSQVGNALVDVSDMYRYSDNETLIHEGYLAFDTGFVLLEGSAEVENERGPATSVPSPALLGEMSQFTAGDRRSATIHAKGVCVALQFSWGDLYAHVKDLMSPENIRIFQDAVEKQVWNRFEHKEILNIGMLADLNPQLKEKVCRPFPSISERHHIAGVDILFNAGGRCQSIGYLLVAGQIKIFRQYHNETIVSAPNIIGIFPRKGEKGTEWSATAMPVGEAEVLQFSWDEYSDALVDRLTREEQMAFIGSIKANQNKHFWH
jgi:hypothetical protein